MRKNVLLFAWALVLAVPVRAELLQVDLSVFGMD